MRVPLGLSLHVLSGLLVRTINLIERLQHRLFVVALTPRISDRFLNATPTWLLWSMVSRRTVRRTRTNMRAPC
jgi:hypothetical protein